MAAYAALLSLRHIIEQLQHHPRPPICLDQNQVQSLTDNLNFLQEFLEQGYPCVGSGKEAIGVFESRIADAAHAAEDLIETRVVDQILAESTAQASKDITETWVGDQILGGSRKTKNSRMQDRLRRILSTFCGAGSSRSPSTRQNVVAGLDLDKVIQDMGLIKKDVMEIKEKNIGIIEDHLHINSSTLAGAASSRSHLTTRRDAVVGLDELLIEVMDKLTGQQSNLRIIPIVGMGGIGKTTLAKNAYLKFMKHFDIRAWVTVSQNYNVREILIEILLCINKAESRETLSAKSEGELGVRVHQSLWGRRYLIVMDDIWSVEVWDKVQIFFPDNGQGSRVMITTRLSNVASIGSHGVVMGFLNEDKSWDLLCRSVFKEEKDCSPELEEIGKKIAKNCEGLPLSIVVIGGHLAKSKRTREHWEYISENIKKIVNSEDDERCLKVLQLSYNHLPVHLKPCFLYMGVFPEDKKIRVSWLVKLWVSEGFVKPINGKSLDVVSREYLQELCDRNMILVHERGSYGNIKFCKIHDLLRELCLREAEREEFLYVKRPHELTIPQGINTQRRIGIHQRMSEKDYHPYPVLRTLQDVPLVRSLICNFEERLPLLDFRLLRVLKVDDNLLIDNIIQYEYFVEVVFRLVNLRFIAIRSDVPISSVFPSFNLLWNLQTLVVNGGWDVVAPCEIWNMTQLKHVHFDVLELPDPPIGGKDDEFILGNLQTLTDIRNFKCEEEVVKRIPNINKLQISYFVEPQGFLSYRVDNLGHLHKLESLRFYIYSLKMRSVNDMVQNFILPNSLKKLTLMGTCLKWEDMKLKIGLLPNLQVLKLEKESFVGHKWETIEGQFCNLKVLLISLCRDLQWWTTDNNHFPRLEHLHLQGLHKLKEIPSCIGEISTLQSIQLLRCSDEAVISAKQILKEQEDFGNVDLRLVHQ
ncbi:hypothetical protein ABFS82_09G075500 [Erythranthe guttata]|uniref:Uncharacterized protein n=1 Tax=Erythranthe guttata TaxID=4155 RepID=A0A022Q1C1_ERYGU|nr:PREDICTED: putative late blight resistance protein homolog R1C-3 [Erythranthe guttata]EYU21836.1 hypothetical protein MIMGU_mgv1a023326mg [Erythranthe guttata]|eukprot:XP_012856433.1 PREDICTED: putative late blight resistance protein homolog R1C-3 [Erythranthe guttata]